MKVTKKLLALLLGLTLMVSMGISVGATEADSTNLLTNPSFENGLEGWTAIRTSHQQESALSGEYSAEFAAPSETAGVKYVQYPQNYEKGILTQKVSGLKGKGIYRFNGFVYTVTTTEGVTRDDYLYIKYTFYSDETPLEATTVEEQKKTPVNAWTKLESIIVLPEEANGVEIGIIHSGGSTYTRTYDEFKLEEIPFAEPAGNLISNPGFEAGATNWTILRGTTMASYDALRTYGTSYTTADHTFSEAPSAEYGTQYMSFPTNTRGNSLMQRVNGVSGGASYKFMGQAYYSNKNSAITPDINVTCIYYNDEGVSLGTDKILTSFSLNTWTTIEAVFTLPKETVSIDIGVSSGQVGDLFIRTFDNFYLVPTDNLLVNGSFESKDIGWSKTSDVAPENDFISTDTHSKGLAYTGQASKWGRLEQSLIAKGGAKYKFTYWFKSLDASSAKSSAIFVRFFEKKLSGTASRSNESLCHIELNTLPLLSSDGWQQYVGYFTAPQNAQGMSVVVKSYSSSGGTGNCIYDDMELSFVDQDIEFVGFSDVNPATLTGVETVLNEASFKDSSSYSSLVNGVKTPAVTLNKITEVNNSSSIFASAVAPSAPDTALVFALFSENEGKKKLEAIDIAIPDENGLITTGITVPETGSYYAEAYILNSMGGLKPITDPIELN